MEHRTDIRPQTARKGQWKAASGKLVPTRMEKVEQFDLRDNRIYILSEAGHALWAGTVTELIEDHASRTRFRDALRRASDVHSVSSPNDPTECMCLIYDLEAGEEQITLNAA